MYLFVNNRFFKDTYFNHAIQSAFDGMIPSKKFPPYFLYFEVPTESIDVNVHPTKTEIKFENRQEIYSILRASIKQALGQFNISSTLDFDQENTFNVPSLKKGEIVDAPVIKVNDNFNPFKTNTISQSTSFPKTNSPFSSQPKSQIKPDVESWESFYEASKSNSNTDTQLEFDSTPNENGEVIIQSKMDNSFESNTKPPYQLHDKYIISPIKSGFIMIDQYRAHSRILFDSLINNWSDDVVKSQQLLFPESFEISATDMVYFNEIEAKLQTVGFDLTVKDNKIITVTGIPIDYENESAKLLIETVLAKFKESQQDQDVDFKAVCAKAFANAKAIKKGVKLTIEEMQHLINELFGSSNPQTSPSGKNIIVTYTLDEITKKFN